MIDLGPQNGSPNGPKSSPRGPQDALGARLPLEVGFGAILGPFLDPPGPRKSCSRCGAVLFFANLASRAREPEIAPQMNPKSSLKRPPEAPECPKMSLQIGARISIKFQLRFLRFGSPKMAPTIAQKNGLRAQGPPRGLQRALREAFWAHSGLNLGPPGAHVRAFSGCTFASFGLLLVYCWCSFSLASSPPLLAF